MEENINAFNSVNFLFAKPYYEGHYYYAIDDINNMSVIDKDSLKKLVLKLGCGNFLKLNYITDRNFPFFYDAKKKEIIEFQETNSEITRKDLENYIHEELKINTKKETSLYERFFGENSNFYKQNFDKETLNGNNQSISCNLSCRKNIF